MKTVRLLNKESEHKMKEKDILIFINYLADEAAKITLPMFGKRHPIVNKSESGFDPVTEVDRDCEKLIRSLIKKEFPNHGILGEEYDSDIDIKEPHWVIDPIDGTRAYISGVPVWGTLIAFNDGHQPAIGLMDKPYSNERFIGTPNEAIRFCNEEKEIIKSSNLSSIDQAILSTSDPLFFNEKDSKIFNKVLNQVKMCQYGLDCSAYGLLASGIIDLVIETRLYSYDIQALIPLIKASGGEVTTWNGEPADNGGNIIASANNILHQAVIKILNS